MVFSEEDTTDDGPPKTPAERLERTSWPGRIAGLFGIAFVVWQIATSAFALSLDTCQAPPRFTV